MTYKVEVIADSTGEWCRNGVKHDTMRAAIDYAVGLFQRWTAVRDWRVVDSEGKVVAAMHAEGGR